MHFKPVAVNTAGMRTVQITRASFRKSILFAATVSLAILPALSSSADQAQDILKKMEGVYKTAKSFESSINIKQSGKSPDGKSVSASTMQQVRYKAPNLFTVLMKISLVGGPAKNKSQTEQIVSDGKMVYQYNPQKKEYVKRPVPPSLPLPQFLQLVMQRLSLPRPGIPNTTLGKPTSLNGHAVNTIQIRPGTATAPPFSFLIDKKTSHLLKITVTSPKINIDVDMSDQKMNANINSSVFAFRIPAGAKEVQPTAPGARGPGGPGTPPGIAPHGGR